MIWFVWWSMRVVAVVVQIPMIKPTKLSSSAFCKLLTWGHFLHDSGALIPLAGFYDGGFGDVSFDPFETSKFLRSVLQLPFSSSLLTLNTGPIVLGWWTALYGVSSHRLKILCLLSRPRQTLNPLTSCIPTPFNFWLFWSLRRPWVYFEAIFACVKSLHILTMSRRRHIGLSYGLMYM